MIPDRYVQIMQTKLKTYLGLDKTIDEIRVLIKAFRSADNYAASRAETVSNVGTK